MKTIVVFGGSGFLGSHLIESLLRQEYKVVNFDLAPLEDPKIVYEQNYHYEVADIRHLIHVRKFVGYGPDVVVNFAGMQGIEECNNYPKAAFESNVIGNLNILETLRRIRYPMKYIYASSVYVYNQISGVYGITKNASELLIKYYANKYHFNYLILRYGTVYGPKATATNSIYKLISEALHTGVISHYGTGEEVREYIHVKDASDYVAEAISKKIMNETLTISNLIPIKAKDLVAMLHDILGDKFKVEFRGLRPDDHYMVTPYKADLELSRKYIGTTCYDLGAGLLSVVNELKGK